MRTQRLTYNYNNTGDISNLWLRTTINLRVYKWNQMDWFHLYTQSYRPVKESIWEWVKDNLSLFYNNGSCKRKDETYYCFPSFQPF